MPGFAVQYPMFQPAMRLITDITNYKTALVITSFDHDFLVGLVVRLYVPRGFGMTQANQLVGTILEVPSTTSFMVSIDTTDFDIFITPAPVPWYIGIYPMVVPIGEVNSTLLQSTRNIL